MNAIFDYFCIKDGYGFFVDNNCNYLFKYRLNNNEIVKKWNLDNGTHKWHQFCSVEMIGDVIVIFPMWGDDIILCRNQDQEVCIERINILFDFKHDLYPIVLNSSSLNKVYACQFNEFAIYKINLETKDFQKLKFDYTIEKKMMENEKGLQKMIIDDDRVYFLPTNRTDYMLCFYEEDEQIRIIEPQVGIILQFLFKEGDFWFLTDDCRIVCWNEETGVIFDKKIIYDKSMYYFYENEYKLLSDKNGVVIIGLFKDGTSLLVRSDNYEFERKTIQGLLFCDETGSYSDNIWVAYNNGNERQFIQMMDGTFSIGNDINSIYEPIDIGIDVMDGVVLDEQKAEKLDDFIRDVIRI